MKMHKLYKELSNINIEKNIEPPFDLHRYLTWSDDESAFISKDAYLSVFDNRELFISESIHWISEVIIVLRGRDSDLKIITSVNNGTKKHVYHSSRTEVDGLVEYTFKINDALSHMICSCPELMEYELLKIKISGVELSKAIDLINGNNAIIKDYSSSMRDEIRNIEVEIKVEEEKLKLIKEEVERFKEASAEMKNAYDLSKQQLETMKTYVKSAVEELDNTNNIIESNKKKNSELKVSINESNHILNEKKESIETKESELIEIGNKLNTYKKEMLMYSEDFKAYKEELYLQNKGYYMVFSLLILFGSGLVLMIYKDAFSIVDNFQFNFDLWTLFVSRLPIISINIFILGTLSGLIYYMIKLIIENKRNIAITKQVAYLVKECVDAQSEELDITDKEKLKQRVELKMSIIRDVIFKSNDQRGNSASDLDDKKLLNLIFERLNNLK